jgi:hypothetical protein
MGDGRSGERLASGQETALCRVYTSSLRDSSLSWPRSFVLGLMARPLLTGVGAEALMLRTIAGILKEAS